MKLNFVRFPSASLSGPLWRRSVKLVSSLWSGLQSVSVLAVHSQHVPRSSNAFNAFRESLLPFSRKAFYRSWTASNNRSNKDQIFLLHTHMLTGYSLMRVFSNTLRHFHISSSLCPDKLDVIELIELMFVQICKHENLIIALKCWKLDHSMWISSFKHF